MRMYLRWAERHGYRTEVYDTSYAEEAGIKSATFQVAAPYAYGTLSVEQGTHRLVRISPFDNQGRRQTSLRRRRGAARSWPRPTTSTIPENDVRVDVYRSSGPGGQSVNTTDSAVRLTHIPTGIVVTCQNEKSQLQNKAAAMRVLQAKLLEKARQDRQAELDALKGDGGTSWGNQMRSYVLHPYQMVKDLRTEHETGNPAAVFDGEIDEFLESGIRWRRGVGEGRRLTRPRPGRRARRCTAPPRPSRRHAARARPRRTSSGQPVARPGRGRGPRRTTASSPARRARGRPAPAGWPRCRRPGAGR